jgi:S-adenosylmethionine:tRNA ribosyltransferase-isomerase
VSAILEVPSRLEAHEPPEERGLRRDEVSLLVATRHDGAIAHASFKDLPQFLEPGDLLVVNTSATLPASVRARLGDRPVELRFSTPRPDGHWIVELRTEEGHPFSRPPIGARLELPGDAAAELVAPYAGSARLSVARLRLGAKVEDYLAHFGRPIRYSHTPHHWPLEAYQTIFASEPGSAEMPSAGRPFTPELVTALIGKGVLLAPVTLHTGVSSPEYGEPPYPERYRVPMATAQLVNVVHFWGGRVIAVGTTVARALETVAEPDGAVSDGEGWTSLVITPERGLRAIDGLVTGWHEPETSHLDLLRAAAGSQLLERSYRAAETHGYRWHEFGDAHLILP